jgi:hypothetical protein
MPGLVSAVHALTATQGVDGRDAPGRDELKRSAAPLFFVSVILM